MKLSLILLFSAALTVSANNDLMSQSVNLDLRDARLSEVFRTLKEQTGQVIIFSDTKVESEDRTVTVKMSNVSLREALDAVLEKLPYTYRIIEQAVYIVPAPEKTTTAQNPVKNSLRGTVTDTRGGPIPGVTIVVKSADSASQITGTATDMKGNYQIAWTGDRPVVVTYSYVGMKTEEIKYSGQKELDVTLREDATDMEEVIVTGYFDRTRQSYTGSEVTVKGDELRQVGSLNLIDAISLFDPAVRTIPNNEYGSDPNRVPEISIRGENGFDLRSSADDSQTNPNAPLYVLDGIEVSATTVYDLDMNRVEAFSILKDAAATALYGSRGANGVILIVTIRPQSGKLRVTLNSNFNISAPDLRDYNLMNAAEKLEYELRAGTYSGGSKEEQMAKDILYNSRLAEVARGVDTYWLSRPLTTSVNQRYSAFVEGGDKNLRYGVDLKYDTDRGVMKKSGRERIGIKVNLNYQLSDKLIVFNELSVDDVTATNTPYGSFSQYTQMNPYERVYDPETGKIISYYESNSMRNPLVNAYLPNKSTSNYMEVKDNLSVDWRIADHLQIKARAAITKRVSRSDNYKSPESNEFEREEDPLRRGSYAITNSSMLKWDANLRVMYNNVFLEKFTVSANVGAELKSERTNGEGYTAIGFLNDNMRNPEYAQSILENSQTGNYDRERLAGFFANVNIGYDNRFFLDGSFRTDGSSKFGRDSRFAPFWSVGLGWNINKESFWNGEGYMKLRGSVGNTGSTNFSSDQAMTYFEYPPNSEYNGYYGAIIRQFGNPSLRWQNTMKYNVGLDMSVWKNIIVLNLDFYIQNTQNLLLSVDVAPSTGFSSYRENMGSIENRGFDARLRFNLIRDRVRNINWNITMSVAHNENKISKLSTAMRKMNEEALKVDNSIDGKVLRLYEVGRSQSALMVVRSMGIDPRTGTEIYIKRDGSLTFDYDPNDKVIVGDTRPKLQGNFQSNFMYKGFNLFLAFSYEYGAKAYNATLAQKVEGARPTNNADKRVLYERWNRPGDKTLFRNIRYTGSVYQTDRLVQDNNFIRLSSVSLTYDMPKKLMENMPFERLRFTATANDVMRLSTIKQERGTSYPFAHSFTLGLSVTF